VSGTHIYKTENCRHADIQIYEWHLMFTQQGMTRSHFSKL